MKKKIIGILVCMILLVVLPGLTSVVGANTLDHPNPWLTITKGGRGVHMGIKNFGNETVTNIHWRILFYDNYGNPDQKILIGRDTSGDILSLAPGEEKLISVNVFGFTSFKHTTLGFFLGGNEFLASMLLVIGPRVLMIPQNYSNDPGFL
jgi:hypothetical protein